MKRAYQKKKAQPYNTEDVEADIRREVADCLERACHLAMAEFGFEGKAVIKRMEYGQLDKIHHVRGCFCEVFVDDVMYSTITVKNNGGKVTALQEFLR